MDTPSESEDRSTSNSCGIPQRGWAMSWGPRHRTLRTEKSLRAHIQAIHQANSLAAIYASPQWYFSRDAGEFIADVRRLCDAYGLDGNYYDGNFLHRSGWSPPCGSGKMRAVNVKRL